MVEKITRDSFLYFDPHQNSDMDEFAQCSTCRMLVPEEYLDGKYNFDLCIIHGSKVEVADGYSCGMYAIWPKGKPNPKVINDHANELKSGLIGSVTPEESGLVDRKVRCENCYFFNGKCQLYIHLNKLIPSLFDLDENVNEYGCCNANTEKPKNGDIFRSNNLSADDREKISYLLLGEKYA